MRRRRQTANIPNLTPSNRQDPHLAAADIRYEMRVVATHAPETEPPQLTHECTRQKMSPVATPLLSRKITQMMVPNN